MNWSSQLSHNLEVVGFLEFSDSTVSSFCKFSIHTNMTPSYHTMQLTKNLLNTWLYPVTEKSDNLSVKNQLVSMVLIKMSSISDPCRLQLSSCVKYYWPWFYIKCPLLSDPRQLRLCSNFVKKPDSGRGVRGRHYCVFF